MSLRSVPSGWVHQSTVPLFQWLEDARTAINAGGSGGTRTIVTATFLSTDATKNVSWIPVGGSGYLILGLTAIDASGATAPIPNIVASTDGAATIGISGLFTNGGTVTFEVVKIP